MKYRMDWQFRETLTNPETASSPEKMLWGAVLERAFRDLELTMNPRDRRDAVLWFKGEETTKGIEFKELTEVLSLSSKVLKRIKDKVILADLSFGDFARAAIEQTKKEKREWNYVKNKRGRSVTYENYSRASEFRRI